MPPGGVRAWTARRPRGRAAGYADSAMLTAHADLSLALDVIGIFAFAIAGGLGVSYLAQLKKGRSEDEVKMKQMDYMGYRLICLGFLLLSVPYAVGLALLVAVIDIMPVLGTGLVLIPWAIIAAVLGSYKMAIGVAALYIIMLAVRNVVEPKLVGNQMGLHPLVTLIAMFVGLQLFGLAGLFGFPIALSLYFKMVKRSRNIKAEKA